MHTNDTDTKILLSLNETLSEKFNKAYVMDNKQNIISTVAARDSGGSHCCVHCDYKTKHLSHFKQHIKSIHEGERYPCTKCDYKATDKSGLRKHVKSIHEGVRYPCDKFDYKAT